MSKKLTSAGTRSQAVLCYLHDLKEFLRAGMGVAFSWSGWDPAVFPARQGDKDMRSLRKALATVIGSAMLMAASQASAYVIDLGGGIGEVDFNTIDWTENGSAWVQDFTPVAGDVFTIDAISQAVSLSMNSVQSASFLDTVAVTPGLTFSAVELTLVAHLDEQVQSVVGNIANFVLLGGRFDIFLDFTPEADNLVTGLGFSDGIRILGGEFLVGQTGSFTDLNLIPPGSPGAAGTGSNFLSASIDFVDSNWVTPSPTSTNATTTLQYGLTAGGWTRPATIDGTDPGPDSPSNFVMKADANQTFLGAVPEPASLALVGLALSGLGFARRRNKAA